jgi:hypothetical protein
MRCQGASTVRSAGLSEQRFQLGEHLLDRIEVRTAGRHDENPRADRANGRRTAWPLWLLRLSMMNNVAGLSVGTRNCSI